ncbi:lipoprotein [Anaeromyxobacter terrae]|uniref:lipoprotein n=1 Tax=Anaeromyxobacter terrae TaxID=2925406 RepID=UPI001F5A696B|nr:lipoprotein [Anaeromyxobacter sp. SG22]
MSRLVALAATALLAACGVKAPPRPPGVERDETVPTSTPTPPSPSTSTSTSTSTSGAPAQQPCP